MRRNAHVRFGGRPAETHPRKRGQGAAGRPYTYVPTWSGFCYTAFVTGPVLPPDRRLGHQQPHGHRLRARRPGAGDLDAQAPRRRRPRGPGPPQRPRISVPVHRLHRTTRRRGHRSHRPEPWAPPTQAPPPRPWASPTSASSSGATAPGRTATTPGTATAQWVNWYNRTRPHRANPDDLSPAAAAEHRYHRNHTTTTAAPPRVPQEA